MSSRVVVVRGPQGPQGPQGEQGPEGPQGPAGGGATPGGSADGQVQFRSGDTFAAGANFVYDSTTGSVRGGSSSTATGTRSFAWGVSCEASGTESVAAGHTAIASGASSVALGYNVQATQTYGNAIGSNIVNNGVAAFAGGENLTINSGCANAVALGFQITLGANSPYSVALGSYVNVVAGVTSGFVCGLRATVRRTAQFQHSSGCGTFAGTAWLDMRRRLNATTGNLQDTAGNALYLDTSTYHNITVDLLAVTANGAKRATETRKLAVLVASDGTMTIDDETAIYGSGDIAAQGWGVTISGAASGELRFSCNAGSDDVTFAARVQWAQIDSLNGLPA